MNGSWHDDVLVGTDGISFSNEIAENEMRGRWGNDQIDGRAGDDTIDGGEGNDTMTGGADEDTFTFIARDWHSHWSLHTPGHDTITDFELGVDRLMFSDIDSLWDLNFQEVNGNAVITYDYATGSITLVGSRWSRSSSTRSTIWFWPDRQAALVGVTGRAAGRPRLRGRPFVLPALRNLVVKRQRRSGDRGHNTFPAFVVLRARRRWVGLFMKVKIAMARIANRSALGSDSSFVAIDWIPFPDPEIPPGGVIYPVWPIVGTDYADNLSGTEDPEDIYGRKGDDVIHGNGGNDYIYGEEGFDLLYGDQGNDRRRFGK